ncbi:hypothetical protein CS542_06360 [Pedobacter sp. IW39]|nr:hypothetical protein CS542_06360 [Pedobacter sp. IW39]
MNGQITEATKVVPNILLLIKLILQISRNFILPGPGACEEDITRTHPEIKSWVWESTPLMINGVLYISMTSSQAAAIDASTGKLNGFMIRDLENGTPSNNGFVHRRSLLKSGSDERILRNRTVT